MERHGPRRCQSLIDPSKGMCKEKQARKANKSMKLDCM